MGDQHVFMFPASWSRILVLLGILLLYTAYDVQAQCTVDPISGIALSTATYNDGDGYGSSITTAGDTIYFGVPGPSGGSGKVDVVKYTCCSGICDRLCSATPAQLLSDSGDSKHFGKRVAGSDTATIIGVSQGNGTSTSPRVHLFDRTTGASLAVLDYGNTTLGLGWANETSSAYGMSLDVDDAYVAIGAPDSSIGNSTDIGSVFVCQWAGGTVHCGRLPDPILLSQGDRFGERVRIIKPADESAVYVMSMASGLNSDDRVFVYKSSTGDVNSFVYQRTLVADGSVTSSHSCGTGLDWRVSNVTKQVWAIVGCPNSLGTGGTGMVHLYRKDNGGADTWGSETIITPPNDGQVVQEFGCAIQANVHHVVVGTCHQSGDPHHVVYIYEVTTSDTGVHVKTIQVPTIPSHDMGQHSVALLAPIQLISRGAVVVGDSAVGTKGQSVLVRNLTTSLDSFTFDVNTGTLTLVFETPIARVIFGFGLQLQNTHDGSPSSTLVLNQDTVHAFSQPSVEGNCTIQFTLNSASHDILLADMSLGVNTGNTFLSWNAGVFETISGLHASVASPQAPTSLIPDTTAPNLVNFAINMTSEVVTLTFSEFIDVANILLTEITLQDAVTASKEVILSTLGSVDTVSNSKTVTISLSATDLMAVKLQSICLVAASCYVRLSSSAAKDTSGNAVTAILDGSALPVSGFTADTRIPKLARGQTVDMAAQQITFNMTEPLNMTTFVVTDLTLQSQLSSDAVSYTLTTSTASQACDVYGECEITIPLSQDDFAGISLIPNLATEKSNSYMSWPSTMVEDLSGNGILPAYTFYGKKAGVYIPDTVAPVLVSWQYDASKRTVRLVCNEPMDIVGANSSFTLWNVGGSTSVDITSVASTLGSDMDRTISFVLHDSDADALALQSPPVCSSSTTCALSFGLDLVDDTAGNHLPGVVTLAVTTLIPDTTQPALVGWDLDMTRGELVLQFNKTMNVSTVSSSQLSIQDAATAGTSVALASSSPVGSASVNITISISGADMNAILTSPTLARSSATSWLTASSSFVRDLAGNWAIPILDGSGMQVRQYGADTNAPLLIGWEINLASWRIVLQYNEAMNASSINPTTVRIQDAATAGVGYTLTGGSVISPDGVNVTIIVSSADKDAITLATGLATSTADSFLTISSGHGDDMSGASFGTILDGSGVQTISYIADTLEPAIISWSLDMNSGNITIVFSEIVNITSLSTSKIGLRSNTTGEESFALGVYPVLQTNDETVTFTIAHADMLQIKLHPNLAKSAATSFLTNLIGMCNDMHGNAITANGPLQATSYVPDTVPPQLIHASLNMSSGVLVLDWDEVVLGGTWVEHTRLTIISGPGGGESVTLTGLASVVPEARGTRTTLALTHGDMEGLRERAGLATGVSNTYLAFTAGFVFDAASVDVDAVSPASPYQIDVFIADTVPPYLV